MKTNDENAEIINLSERRKISRSLVDGERLSLNPNLILQGSSSIAPQYRTARRYRDINKDYDDSQGGVGASTSDRGGGDGGAGSFGQRLAIVETEVRHIKDTMATQTSIEKLKVDILQAMSQMKDEINSRFDRQDMKMIALVGAVGSVIIAAAAVHGWIASLAASP